MPNGRAAWEQHHGARTGGQPGHAGDPAEGPQCRRRLVTSRRASREDPQGGCIHRAFTAPRRGASGAGPCGETPGCAGDRGCPGPVRGGSRGPRHWVTFNAGGCDGRCGLCPRPGALEPSDPWSLGGPGHPRTGTPGGGIFPQSGALPAGPQQPLQRLGPLNLRLSLGWKAGPRPAPALLLAAATGRRCGRLALAVCGATWTVPGRHGSPGPMSPASSRLPRARARAGARTRTWAGRPREAPASPRRGWRRVLTKIRTSERKLLGGAQATVHF